MSTVQIQPTVHVIVAPIEFLPGCTRHAAVSRNFFTRELAEAALAHVRKRLPDAVIWTWQEERDDETAALIAKAEREIPQEQAEVAKLQAARRHRARVTTIGAGPGRANAR